MGNLLLEFLALVRAFNEAKVTYAVAGGFAVSLHGYVRATKDIDFVVWEESLPQAVEVAKSLGYHSFSPPSVLAEGKLSVTRLLKMAGPDQDPFMLDLLVYPAVFAQDFQIETIVVETLSIPVLNRSSLAVIKLLRGSDKDRDDLTNIGVSLL